MFGGKVYKYSYGNEDLLRASIIIYKIGNTNEYIIDAEFSSFDMKYQPKYFTVHKVITYDKEEITDEETGTITIKHKLKINAPCNPPPETIVKFK